MRCLIIMPVHNEGAHLREVLLSFVHQSRPPDMFIIVNDHSTDNSESIIAELSDNHDWISSVTLESASDRIPGAKVVSAFNKGLSTVDKHEWDLIGKFDGDILLPPNYFETTIAAFENNPKLGLVGGLLYIQQQDSWIYEAVSKKQKVRGPIKLYRVECFDEIGGLRKGIGWDTADQILCEFYGWKSTTIKTLEVKHLKPTGSGYSTRDAEMQGLAFHNLRYGWWISVLAAFKLALHKKSIHFLFTCINSYLKASSKPIVTKKEGQFIRKYRKSQMGK